MRPSALSLQRKPTITQSAVRYGFTLTTPSREPGRYGDVEPLGHDAVEAGRVEAVEPALRLLRGRASPGRAGSAWPCAPARVRASRAAACARLALPEQDVEGDELGRDLRRELPDAALGRVEPQLHRVEVECPVAGDDDLAVEGGVGREEVAERPRARGSTGEAGRPFRLQSASSPPTFSRTPRKPSHFGSYCQSPVGQLVDELGLHGRERELARRHGCDNAISEGELEASKKVLASASRNASSRWRVGLSGCCAFSERRLLLVCAGSGAASGSGAVPPEVESARDLRRLAHLRVRRGAACSTAGARTRPARSATGRRRIGRSRSWSACFPP